jgi:hypoxanthine phosphoribosyltransferase
LDITYEVFTNAIDSIVKQIKDSGIEYKKIIGISRGGLIPATVLSHKLGVPLRTVEWSLRDSQIHAVPVDILHRIENNKVLLVDDIVDGGDTIKSLLDYFGVNDTIDVACLVYNTAQTIATPRYYYHTIDRSVNQSWINFWWEQK